MKIFFSFLFLILISYLLSLPKVYAANQASDAAQLIQDSLKERVQKVKETTDPQVKALMTTLKLQKFGLIGTIEKIVGATLQIRNSDNALRVGELDKMAVILKNNKPIPKSELELNSPVIAMGYRTSEGALQIKRLISSDESIFGVPNLSFYGKVHNLTTKYIGLSDGNFKLTPKTEYLNTLGYSIKRTDIKSQDSVVVVTASTGDATTSAKRVYLFPTK